jgi:PAS domain S-box-containing protein
MARGTFRLGWPNRLRGSLTLLFLLLPTLAIGIVTTYAALSYRHAQRSALLEEARTILLLLVQHHPAAIGGSTDGKTRIQAWAIRVAELPRRDARIAYVALRGPDGRYLTDSNQSSPNLPFVGPEEGFVTPNLLSLDGSAPVAHASAQIKELDDAYVQIGLRMSPGWASLAHLHDVLGIFLVTLLLNIWMIRTGLRRLITPLEALVETSRTLADGKEAQPVSVSGPEEVAKLGEAFNDMLMRRQEDSSRIEYTMQQLREERTASEFERYRFTSMVEALHEGLAYINPDGCVVYANPEAERLLGRSAEDLASTRILIREGDTEPLRPDSIVASLIGDEAWRSVKEKYYLNLALVVVHTSDRKRQGYMLLLRDRSDEHRVQRLMAERDRIASVGMLAAGIAHEINNPLDGLQNCLRRIVKDPKNTDQIERYAGLMTASLHHIETVIRQLLNLSHKQDRSVRRIDINETIRGAVELARAGQRWNGIELDWRLGDNLPPVLADPQNISQVFLNLMLNAVDAMPTGGTLTVTTRLASSPIARSKTEDVLVEIRDTGDGISPEVLPRIFEPFFTTKGREKGTGLGLSVSRNLIVEHGGEIEVKSEPGQGAVFSVWLPTFFPTLSVPPSSTEAT